MDKLIVILAIVFGVISCSENATNHNSRLEEAKNDMRIIMSDTQTRDFINNYNRTVVLSDNDYRKKASLNMLLENARNFISTIPNSVFVQKGYCNQYMIDILVRLDKYNEALNEIDAMLIRPRNEYDIYLYSLMKASVLEKLGNNADALRIYEKLIRTANDPSIKAASQRRVNFLNKGGSKK